MNTESIVQLQIKMGDWVFQSLLRIGFFLLVGGWRWTLTRTEPPALGSRACDAGAQFGISTMGRRKKTTKKISTKKKQVVSTVFKCPFCSHDEAVECKMFVGRFPSLCAPLLLRPGALTLFTLS